MKKSPNVIVKSIGGIHKLEKYFKNPLEFNPDRHVHNGEFRNDKHVNFFSFGKRRCVGEALAKENAYMAFTNLVQKFQFKRPPNEELDFTPKLVTFLEAKPYKMLVSPRQ